jgi:hypothetical protein
VLAAALGAVADGTATNQKSGRRKALYPLALGGGPETTHLLKVNRYPARDGFRRRLVASKARRELALAEAIAGRGVATPVPLAAGEARRGGRVRACYLLVPFVAGAVDLRRRAAEPLRPGDRRALASSFGRFARAVHDAAISQDDFQPNNFLLGPGGAADLFLIDCERIALRKTLAEDEATWQLAKLERELPAASLADRARFVAAYAGGAGRALRGERRAMWARVGAVQPALARHDAARILRAIAARGRRFAPVALAGWRGVATAGALPTETAAAVAAALSSAPAVASFVPAGGAAFALGLAPATRRTHERALATAVLLARRGLAPAPLALLRRAREGCLVFAGALPARLEALSARERRARLPALTGLLARLARLGRLAPPRAGQLGLAAPPAPLPITLLAPPLLEPGAAAPAVPRAEHRAQAARILGIAAP